MGTARSVPTMQKNPVAAWGSLTLILANGVVMVSMLRDRPYEYEANIYSLVPWWGWVIFGASFAFGAAVLAYGADRRDTDGALVPTLMAPYASYLIIAALPILLGYPAWGRGDPFTHMGTIQEIVREGTTGGGVIYPVAHLLAAFLHFMTEVPLDRIVLFLPWVLAALHPWWILATARLFGAEARPAMLVTIIAMGFVTGWFINFTPNHLGNLYVPFVLLIAAAFALARGNRSRRLALLLFLVALLLPPFHVLVAVGATLFVAGLALAVTRPKHAKGHPRRLTNHVQFLGIWSVVWISSFIIFERTVGRISQQLASDQGPRVQGVASAAERGAELGFNPVIEFLKAHSPTLLMMALAATSVIFIVMHRRNDLYARFAIAMLFAAVIVQVLIFVSFIVNLPFAPFRFLVYVFLATLFLGAIAFRHLLDGRGRNAVAGRTVAVALVLAIVATSVITLYRSPYLHVANEHLHEEEVDVVMWLGDHGEVPRAVFANTLQGALARSGFVDHRAPFHFDWDESDVVASRFCRELVTNPLDRQVYTVILPELAEIRWEPADFERLGTIPGSHKVYESGAVQVWRECPDQQS